MITEYFVIHVLLVTLALPDGTEKTGELHSVIERSTSRTTCVGKAKKLEEHFEDFPGKFVCKYQNWEKGRL